MILSGNIADKKSYSLIGLRDTLKVFDDFKTSKKVYEVMLFDK